MTGQVVLGMEGGETLDIESARHQLSGPGVGLQWYLRPGIFYTKNPEIARSAFLLRTEAAASD